MLQLSDNSFDDLVLKKLRRILNNKLYLSFISADHKADVAAELLQREIQLDRQAVLIVNRRIPHVVYADVKNRAAAVVAGFDKFCNDILKRQRRFLCCTANRFFDR